jgi:transcriptional regulator with XRE-family HTH domain
MTDFDQKLLRLKQVLGLTEDQAVAAVLGLTKAAFSERKRRSAFPEDKVLALAARRPELNIDATYVFTGLTAKEAASEIARNFPTRLREIRGKRSAATFAKSLGVSVTELAALESGAQRPNLEFLKRYVAAHPDASAGWLLGGDAPTLETPLSDIEAILVKNFRNASQEGKEALQRQAAFHAEYASRKAEK